MGFDLQIPKCTSNNEGTKWNQLASVTRKDQMNQESFSRNTLINIVITNELSNRGCHRWPLLVWFKLQPRKCSCNNEGTKRNQLSSVTREDRMNPESFSRNTRWRLNGANNFWAEPRAHRAKAKLHSDQWTIISFGNLRKSMGFFILEKYFFHIQMAFFVYEHMQVQTDKTF